LRLRWLEVASPEMGGRGTSADELKAKAFKAIDEGFREVLGDTALERSITTSGCALALRLRTLLRGPRLS